MNILINYSGTAVGGSDVKGHAFITASRFSKKVLEAALVESEAYLLKACKIKLTEPLIMTFAIPLQNDEPGVEDATDDKKNLIDNIVMNILE